MSAMYLEHDGEMVEMVEAPYEAEAVLQALLADHPRLLAGEETEAGEQHWLFVQREVGIGSAGRPSRWSVDHLFLDRAGIPTLVEVKRSSDSRARREVFAQMLDYAANLSSSLDGDAVRRSFEAERRARGEDPEAGLAALLGDDADVESFWSRVGANLSDGRLRLVFVGDEFPDEFRQIFDFLREQWKTVEVVALEVRQYAERDGSRRVLVPRLVGHREPSPNVPRARIPGKRPGRRKIGATPREGMRREFHQALKELCEQQRSPLRALLGSPPVSNSYVMELRPGFVIDLNVTHKDVSCELKISAAAGERAFELLRAKGDAIEAQLGALRWAGRRGGSWSIGQSHPADTRDRASWPALNEWRLERGEAFLEVFAPLVEDLSA